MENEESELPNSQTNLHEADFFRMLSKTFFTLDHTSFPYSSSGFDDVLAGNQT